MTIRNYYMFFVSLSHWISCLTLIGGGEYGQPSLFWMAVSLNLIVWTIVRMFFFHYSTKYGNQKELIWLWWAMRPAKIFWAKNHPVEVGLTPSLFSSEIVLWHKFKIPVIFSSIPHRITNYYKLYLNIPEKDNI